MWTRCILRHLSILLATLLLGGLLGATLVRIGPGFGVDEQELDTRLHNESIHRIRQSRAGEKNILNYYVQFISGAFHGDLGVSHSLGRPVSELFRERAPVTFRWLLVGLAGGWILGIALALPGAARGGLAFDLAATVLSGLFLCMPVAALAILLIYVGGPGPLAIAAVVFPRIFRYSRNLLSQAYNLPHVLTARAKGLHGTRILLFHVLPNVAPQLLALAATSVSVALSATIPIEAICDSPGIGQLAWQAALGRDLPVLVNVTLLVTMVTLTMSSLSDLAGRAFSRSAA
jgi:peptide/nickel transport system permease protein